MSKFIRPLPLELLAEMHKCLPLADAINILVNISNRAIYQNNSPRMLRTVQRIKKSVNEYIDSLVREEDKNLKLREEDLEIYYDIPWKPQFDTFLRYGKWITPAIEKLDMCINSGIVGLPENFFGDLLLHLTNSRWTKLMLPGVAMHFQKEQLIIPAFLMPLLKKKKRYYYWRPFLFQSVQSETVDGQILHFFDGESYECLEGGYELRFFMMNKMDTNKWFEIIIDMDRSIKFIDYVVISVMKPLHEKGKCELNWLKDYRIENGNKLVAEENIHFDSKWDLFMRRGAAFSQFRHFKVKLGDRPTYYADLISYISDTKHPEDFLDSIDITFEFRDCSSALLIEKFWKSCCKGMRKGGKFIELDKKRLHILSAKVTKPKKKLEFTLVNGAYLFDVDLQFDEEKPDRIAGIKIQKRKCNNIVELKSRERKRKQQMMMNGPTYSGKIMKK